MARKIRGSDEQPARSPSQPESAPAASPVPGVSMRDLGVADGVASPELPRLDPRPPALILVHPERWTVLHGQVVPLVGRLPLVAGVGLVRSIRGRDGRPGGISIQDALARKRELGWREIPLDVDGPGTSYLHQPAPGVYLTTWETAHAGSSQITVDGPRFARWLRALISRRQIAAPAPYVLEGLRRRLQSQIAALQDQVRTVPSVQVQLDARLADLEVVERELRAVPLTPAPTRAAGLEELVREPQDTPDQE